MNVTEPFVLKQDVLLIPCADLSDDVRSRISFDDGDFTLSVRHGRALSQVIDGRTAALLGLFREPRTLVEAILENSRALDCDPEARLDEMLPHLGRFVQSGVLVRAGSDEEKEIRPRYDSGTIIGTWKIVRCASLIEDSEIYQLRNGSDVAALKIARHTTPRLQAVFDNEVEVLRHLDGSGIAPRLLDAGVHEERPYLIIDWIAGVDAGVAAAQRRHDRAALLELCASIAAAYAELHARGVLHGDVHARNVIAGDGVLLLDFGYSRFADRPPRTGRAGVSYFFEPEFLAGKRQNVSVPASLQGEQYAVAALLYALLTGHHYVEFRYEREEMERQVEEDPPLPFAGRGIPPWPDVERILFRALEKDPSRRHGSMAEMAALLAEARGLAVRESLAAPVSEVAKELVEAKLRSFARGGEMFVTGYRRSPHASITYGCAGAAVGLLRLAEIRGDPALLALADLWRSRAVALIDSPGAYYDAERDLTPEILGNTTPYHTASGIHAAAAMIAAAKGDTAARRRAVAAFLDASSKPCPQVDLTLGRSGTLLATSLLLATGDETGALRAFGTATMRAIWEELDARPPIEASPRNTYFGMAHGLVRVHLRGAAMVRRVGRPAAGAPGRSSPRIRRAEDAERTGRVLASDHRCRAARDHARLVQRQRRTGVPLHARAPHARRRRVAAARPSQRLEQLGRAARPFEPLLRHRRPRLRAAQSLQAHRLDGVAEPRPPIGQPRRVRRGDDVATRQRPLEGRARRGRARRRPRLAGERADAVLRVSATPRSSAAGASR